jgi:hypothetical protein
MRAKINIPSAFIIILIDRPSAISSAEEVAAREIHIANSRFQVMGMHV